MKNNRKLSGYLIDPSYQGKFLLIFGGFGVMQTLFFFYAIHSLFEQIKLLAGRSSSEKEMLIEQLDQVQSSMFTVFGSSFLVLTVFFLIVAFRFTHKTAGALFHFKKSFDEMGEDKKLKELKLRDGDFFRDVEKSFNEMIKKL